VIGCYNDWDKGVTMAEEAREQESKFTVQMLDWRNTATDKFL